MDLNKQILKSLGLFHYWGDWHVSGMLYILQQLFKPHLKQWVAFYFSNNHAGRHTHVHNLFQVDNCKIHQAQFCEIVVQWAWGIIFLYELATTESSECAEVDFTEWFDFPIVITRSRPKMNETLDENKCSDSVCRCRNNMSHKNI